uniref:Uncharacterized protein AlNc14C171G8011 n=1 Tax=Albugo laibachii Nc14 TaxID=890382 RepID=F0WEJ6_9STRA|nr:conserved hypothetical protein [Albugo laibachii Nc14]CCA22878.1 conserved hypothetical protein [Albugo laibachii Nc14]|eukprot:CCA22878.1 conserved hypothetical protein [Albugo laibachii Nc14]
MASRNGHHIITAPLINCTFPSNQSSVLSSCPFEEGELLAFIDTIYEDFTEYLWSSTEPKLLGNEKFATDALLLDLSVDEWSNKEFASSAVTFFDTILADEKKSYHRFGDTLSSTAHNASSEEKLFTPLNYWDSNFSSTDQQLPGGPFVMDPALKKSSDKMDTKLSDSMFSPRVLSSQCVYPGCPRIEQTNGLCIRHGGGRRCSVIDCNRGAQAQGRCKSHGGGTRCKVIGCTRSNQGGGFCRSHGGGKLCTYPGCKKGIQRRGYCSAHGGARLCKIAGCSRIDRGRGLCAQHKQEIPV